MCSGVRCLLALALVARTQRALQYPMANQRFLCDPAADLDVLLSEDLKDVRTAAAESGVPRLSYWVLLRARERGQLEAVKIGGRVMTSAAAIRRWIHRINERPVFDEVPRRRTRRVKRPVTSEAARRFLESRGLMLPDRRRGNANGGVDHE